MIKIIKRDGRKQRFNEYKIKKSVKYAAADAEVKLKKEDYEKIINIMKTKVDFNSNNKSKKIELIAIDTIQDYLEDTLKSNGYEKIQKAYSFYRQERSKIRNTKLNIMKTIKDISIETDRDNANVGNNFSAKLLRIASEASKWTILSTMPKDLAKLHENNDLYFHDLDSFSLTTNCLHIPTRKMLLSGFNTGYGTINAPKRIESAAELSCILLQSTQNKINLFL